MAPSSQHFSPADLLFEAELKIARRADEIAQAIPAPSSLNLKCWLLAEAEILGGEPWSPLWRIAHR